MGGLKFLSYKKFTFFKNFWESEIFFQKNHTFGRFCYYHSFVNDFFQRYKCNLDMIPDTTEGYGTPDAITTPQPSIPMSNPVHPSPEPETIVWEEEEGKCPRAWYVMSPLTA